MKQQLSVLIAPSNFKAFDVLERIRSYCDRHIKDYGSQYDAFCIFVFFFYIINPFKWKFIGPYPADVILVLRVIALSLWACLVVWRFWPKFLKSYLPLFFYFSLCYLLPLRTTFNVLYSPNSEYYERFGVLGIVALAVLVDGPGFAILTSLGIVFGTAVFFLCGGTNLDHMGVNTMWHVLLMTGAVAFIKLVLFRNRDSAVAKKLDAYKTLAGAIAHEVRSPLANMAADAQMLTRSDKKTR